MYRLILVLRAYLHDYNHHQRCACHVVVKSMNSRAKLPKFNTHLLDLTSCVAWGKFNNFSLPQFLNLVNVGGKKKPTS